MRNKNNRTYRQTMNKSRQNVKTIKDHENYKQKNNKQHATNNRNP